MAGPEVDPLQRLRQEAQRLGGAIAEFDTTVNNKVEELYPQFLEGKSGDDFLESAISLGETVRGTVGNRPLLEAQKRRLDWAIQIGELVEEGLFGDKGKGEEIFGKALEILRESGIILEEIAPPQELPVGQVVTVPLYPRSTTPFRSGADVAPPVPPPLEVLAPPPIPAETELKDKIELRICPIEEGQEDEVATYSLSRDQIEKDFPLVLSDDRQIPLTGRRKELINLVSLIPDGMTVFKTSITGALGISATNLDTLVSATKRFLKVLGADHTIENPSKLGSEARYYWKKIEQQVGVEVHDGGGEQTPKEDASLATQVATDAAEVGVPVEPTSGNGEETVLPPAATQGAEFTLLHPPVDISELDENAIRQLKANWSRRRIENVFLVLQDVGDDQLHSRVNNPVDIFAVMSADATVSNRVFNRSPDSVTTEEFRAALLRVNKYMKSENIDDLGDLLKILKELEKNRTSL